ncbi:tyrosine--tRNA ligase, partial [Acinetobacter baumannii]|nr:tyrosine--tRNA ligase [Acinetobacter baumannii]
LQAEDEKVVDYLKVFSPRGREEIEELARQTREEPYRRAAQRALADDVTALVHGEPERDAAVVAGQALFGQHDLAELPEPVLAGVVSELGGGEVDVDTGWPSVAEVLQAGGVVASRSAGRRAAAEGGAY